MTRQRRDGVSTCALPWDGPVQLLSLSLFVVTAFNQPGSLRQPQLPQPGAHPQEWPGLRERRAHEKHLEQGLAHSRCLLRHELSFIHVPIMWLAQGPVLNFGQNLNSLLLNLS